MRGGGAGAPPTTVTRSRRRLAARHGHAGAAEDAGAFTAMAGTILRAAEDRPGQILRIEGQSVPDGGRRHAPHQLGVGDGAAGVDADAAARDYVQRGGARAPAISD